MYVVVQSVGAIAGSGVLRALSPERMEGALGVVSLSAGVTPVQGFGIEFFLAFILVLVVCGACDAAKPHSKGMAPLIIGLAVTVGHLVGVRYFIYKILSMSLKYCPFHYVIWINTKLIRTRHMRGDFSKEHISVFDLEAIFDGIA